MKMPSFLIKCVITTCLIILSNLAHSQLNYRIGYIITMEQDTVWGKIKFKSNKTRYEYCLFRKDKNTTKYSPSEIKGYGLDNQRFFISNVKENEFVEYYVKGKMDLFKSSDGFLVRKDNKITALKEEEKLTEIDGKVGLKKNEKMERCAYFT